MDLSAGRREKTRHLQSLVPLLAARPDIKLLLACRENSVLSELAEKHKLDTIICKSGSGALMTRLKLGWRLRKPSEPWLLQCFDQQALALAMRVAAKKNHLNIIYSALRPEGVNSKRVTDNLHLVGAVIADTRHIADIMVSHGFLQSTIFVIPSCIDISSYPARRPRDDGRIIFACSDPLEENRGYEQLLQGMAYLYGYENMPPWEVRIAAEGPMFEAFLEKARELHVDSRLAIFGGMNGPDILRDCEIMITPANKNDGASLSIKEGWAAGLAVICSDLSSNRELVTDGKNGLLFQNDNPADLADKMHKLAKDADRRAALAESGRASLADYNCERILQGHLILYNKILGQEANLGSLKI